MRGRRVLLAGLAYALGAFALDLLLRALVPVLVLPPLFMTLARALLALGFAVVVAAAWTYRPPRS